MSLVETGKQPEHRRGQTTIALLCGRLWHDYQTHAAHPKRRRTPKPAVTGKPSNTAARIADELAVCGVKLVASLPDNWVMDLIRTISHDQRFRHVPVNREESAIGLCSGAYMGAMGSAALMGASGFMTVVYAITKINYTYEIPLFLMATLRGAVGDHHKHHASNGLYLLPLLDAISMPYQIIDKPDDIGLISRCYHHTRTYSRPMVVLFTRDLLRGEH
jgi:sulfopyruvate decarboxylase subunit alpha